MKPTSCRPLSLERLTVAEISKAVIDGRVSLAAASAEIARRNSRKPVEVVHAGARR